MRIIAGDFKGRAITAPKGRATRPTSDRTREALFNVLQHAPWAPPLGGMRVMDIFAGSGALGLEALSRGAAFALFIETDAQARGAIRQNVETFQLFGTSKIFRRSATALGPLPAGLSPSFDLAFLDPPYHKDLVTPALMELRKGGWLKDQAVIMVETANGETPDLAGWDTLDMRTYGAADIRFLRQV